MVSRARQAGRLLARGRIPASEQIQTLGSRHGRQKRLKFVLVSADPLSFRTAWTMAGTVRI
jgi:hypothetical protein